MKNLFAYFALCLTVVFGLAVSSCGENLCKDAACGTHGTCNETDGACVCETGYQVNSKGACDSVSREKFLATYSVVDITTGGQFNYTSTIASSANGIEKVIINNYAGYGAGTAQLAVPATVELNKLTVPAQTISFNNQSFVIGATSATLIGNTFTLNYTVTIDGGTPETGVATYTKQ